MASLVYSTICSLDGVYEDEDGDFSWAEPGPELHAFVNADNDGFRTVFYGRRVWETMRYWETAPTGPGVSAEERDWTLLWRSCEKHVWSRTLTEVDTSRTTLHSRFDPDEVRALLAAADTDVTIGGADLTRSAFEAGLVDEIRQVMLPVVVGNGPRALPPLRLDLELVEEHAIGATGAVYTRHRVLR